MHLAFELFVAMAKAKIQHVPYRGSPQAITDLLGKRVDFQVDTPAALMPLIREGKLRAIAITGPERFFMLPDAPAIGDTVKGYAVTSWLGVAGPAGLPAPFVEQGQRGGAGDPGRAGGDRTAARARQRSAADHAGRVQGARRRRCRQMDEGGGRREDSEGMNRRDRTMQAAVPFP